MSILTAADVASSNITPDPSIVAPACFLSPYNHLRMTPLQACRLYQLINTPVRDEDLAGDLILWKGFVSWHDGPAKRFVKMVVPAAAARRRSRPSGWGARNICAEYVDVISVFDGKGNAIDHVSSYVDKAVVYKAGTRVSPVDYPPFVPEPNKGIWGFLTLIEALDWGNLPWETSPELAPLGL